MTARNSFASMRAFRKPTKASASFGRGRTTRLLPVMDDQIASGYVLPPRPEVRHREDPARFQQSPTTEVRRFSDRVEHEIEGLADSCEVLGGVVHRAVRAEGFHEIEMPRRDDRRHLGAIVLRELHRRRANGAGRAVDQDRVAGLEVEFLQTIVRVPGALADDGLVKARACGHGRDRALLGNAQVFRMSAGPIRRHAKDALARL